MNASTPPSRLALSVALGTVYVVWGSTYLAIAYTIDTLPSLLSAGTRFLTAAVVLAGVVAAVRGRAALRATRERRLTAAVVGVLLLVGGNGLVVVAEEKVASGLAALLVAMTPVWIVVLRSLARDRPTAGTVGGVVLGFAGVAVLLLPGGGGGETDVGHALLVVLAAFLWACGSYLGTRRPMPPDPFAATAYEMAAGGLALLLLGSVRGEWRGFHPAEVTAASWLGLAYLVVFGSLVAFTAFVWLLAHAPVSTVATYAYVNPVVAVTLGALLHDEPVTASVVAGGVVIVAAVAVIVSEDGRRQRRARRAAALPVEEPAPG